MIGEYYNADCMDQLIKYKDNHFDLAIVDPPYGIGASKPTKKTSIIIQRNGNKQRVKRANYKHKDWDKEVVSAVVLKEIIRVSKNQIIWGVNYLPLLLQGGRIIWDKLNGTSDQYDCEIAYNSMNNRTDIIRYLWSGMFQGKQCHKNARVAIRQKGDKRENEKRIHPTQKPVALYRWLLQRYAKKGDLILDTHVGSASSLIACELEGFSYVGFEKDADYYKESLQRIQNFLSQKRLF